MKVLSLFSGCGAFELAARSLGMTTVAVAEVDPHAIATLAHHFPDTPNLGDVTQIDATQFAGSIDILVGGSPCQNFSLNGDRSGLRGNKSCLAIDQIRIAYECQAPYFVWENVVGSIAGQSKTDFSWMCGLLRECGYGLAYRVLHAPDFGLPQSRDRVLLVGVLGAGPDRPARALSLGQSFGRPTAADRVRQCLDRYGRDLSRATFGFNGKRSFRTAQLERCPTLLAGGHDTSRANDGRNMAIVNAQGCRWLSDHEKARLQGFPSDWFNIPEVPRRFRHKMAGNSIPVPFCDFVLRGIQQDWGDRGSGS